MKLEAVENTSKIRIDTGIAAVGHLLLWVPEAIASNTGMSAIYPIGTWDCYGPQLRQHVAVDNTLGPGNCPKVDEDTFECCGIRIPADCPVEWTATVAARECVVDFRIKLTNLGDKTLRKAGAAICLRFLDAPWWSDEDTHVLSSGKLVPLSSLGRHAGRPNTFQAFSLSDQSYDNVFYREFWGFNRHRLDRPLMISENRDEDVCSAIQADRAYFLHSNHGNPCTDVMLYFGDMEPKATSEAGGKVWVKKGQAADMIQEMG